MRADLPQCKRDTGSSLGLREGPLDVPADIPTQSLGVPAILRPGRRIFTDRNLSVRAALTSIVSCRAQRAAKTLWCENAPMGQLLPSAAALAYPIKPSETGAPQCRGEFESHELLQALPVALYTTDAGGRITFYNEAAAALWGCRPELGKSEICGSWRLYWPDGRPMRHDECPMAIALKEQRAISGAEAAAERPDGVRVPFLAYPRPLFDETGRLAGAVNTLIDITDHKKKEEAAQRLAAIVESSDDAIVSKGLDGIIATWNPGAERLFGYTAEEAIGKPVTILIPPDHLDEEPEILARIRRGERIEHYETIRRRKDGGLVDISLTVSPITNSDGRVIGASKIARDISERRKAQEKQRESEQLFRSLFDSAPIGVFLCDRSGVIQVYNERAAQIWGRRPVCGDPNERYCGSLRLRLPDGELLPHDQSPIVEVLHAGERRENIGAIIERKDGSQTFVLANFAPLTSAQGEVTGAVTSFIDISERWQAQEQQRLLFREMNHRIRNLFTLAGTLVSLSTRFAATPQDLADAVNARLVALGRAHDLTLPNITGGAKHFDRATTLPDLAQTILAPYRTDGSLTIHGPDVLVSGKPAMSIALLLHELATNAAKYGALTSEAGRVELRWRVSEHELLLTWRERGGPPVTGRPETEGFGSLLARRTATGQLHGKISHDWNEEGLTVNLSAPVDRLVE
jgi:PAS domain S-box-containing protein